MNIKFLVAALSITSLIFSSPTFAQERTGNADLWGFCNKFPQNSKCEGIESPIALKQREGTKTRCELRWSKESTGKNCKYQVEGDSLIVYLEVGKKTDFLDDQRPTQEIKITPDNLMFFPTAKHYIWKKRLFNSPQLISNIDIFFNLKSNSQTSNRSNRLRIFVKHQPNEKEQPEQKVLMNFWQSNIHLNKDQKAIANKIKELQSSDLSTKDETQVLKAVEQLLSTKSCVRCNLSGANLTDADLEGANLEGANLNDAILENANLNKAYLLGANLQNTNLHDASLKFAELPYSSLTKANLQSANLSAANLEGVDLMDGDLSSSRLQRFTNLQSANLTNTNFYKAKLTGVNLKNANLTSANFEDAKISVGKVINNSGEVIYLFTYASNFSNTNLTNANLTNVVAKGSIFNRANLANTKLLGIDLSPDEFQYGKRRELFFSNLTEANLSNADLSNAKLDKAQFDGANLEGVILTDSTLKLTQLGRVNLTNSDLTNANFHKAYLVDADLTNATLANTRMTKINMNGIDLSGVNIEEADLKGSTLCQAMMPDGSISKEDCEEDNNQ